MHALSEKPHGGGKSNPAKPAEGLLRTVREEDHATDKTKNGDGWIVRGVDEFAEHGHAPPSFSKGKSGLKETEMLHRFRWVVDTKAANRGIRAVWILHRQ